MINKNYYEWMKEWMDEWIEIESNEWMNEWTYGRTDERTNELIKRLGCVTGWMDGRMYRQMNAYGWMDGWKSEKEREKEGNLWLTERTIEQKGKWIGEQTKCMTGGKTERMDKWRNERKNEMTHRCVYMYNWKDVTKYSWMAGQCIRVPTCVLTNLCNNQIYWITYWVITEYNVQQMN